MEYQVQMASVDKVGRPFTIDNQMGTDNPEVWQTVARGLNAEQALADFLEELNAENITIDNEWFRLLTPKNEVV